MTERSTVLVVGIWIMVSPWALGFSDISVAMWSNVLCGIVLVILGAWSIFQRSQQSEIAGKSSHHPQK